MPLRKFYTKKEKKKEEKKTIAKAKADAKAEAGTAGKKKKGAETAGGEAKKPKLLSKKKQAAAEKKKLEEEKAAEEAPPPLHLQPMFVIDGKDYRTVPRGEIVICEVGTLVVQWLSFYKKFYTATITQCVKSDSSFYVKFHEDNYRMKLMLKGDEYMKTWSFIELAEESQQEQAPEPEEASGMEDVYDAMQGVA